MAVGNEITVVGNITRDVELKFTPKGNAVANFGIAWNKRWKDRDGEWQEEGHYFEITAWNELAENAAESFSKGDRVLIMGSLRYETWEDKDSGDKRSKVTIVADEIGATVRWATVRITKVEKKDGNRDGGRSGGGSRGGDRGGRGGDDRGRGNGGGDRGGRGGGGDNFDAGYDEEPF